MKTSISLLLSKADGIIHVQLMGKTSRGQKKVVFLLKVMGS